MKKILLFMTLCVALLATSCSSQKQMYKGKELSLAPTEVRLDLDMSNLELLGETTIEVEYRKYLGFIRSIDTVNGKEYNRREKRSVSLNGKSYIGVSGTLNRAKYKVVEEFPGADCYMPVYSTKDKFQMFLGSSTKATATYRAYKYVK